MPATNTKKAIENIRKEMNKLEQAIDQDGVPVDAPLYFGRAAEQAALGAAASTQEFGEQ